MPKLTFPPIDEVLDGDEFAFGERVLLLRRSTDPNSWLLDVFHVVPARYWVCQFVWKVTEAGLVPRTEQCNENVRLVLEAAMREVCGWQPYTPSYLINIAPS